MNIKKYYLTQNRCFQNNQKREPIGIQLHTIGCAQGTAKAVADYWNQAAVSACVTYIVDCDMEGLVLQCLPEDVYTWADGGYGNRNLITFEICESDYMRYTNGADYTITNEENFRADIRRGYRTAVELCAEICNRYKWDPKAKLPSGLYLISSHDEGRRAGLSTGHVDPTHIWDRYGWSMDQFREDVARQMGASGVEQEKEQEPKTIYRVRKTWTDVQSQIGAYEKIDNAMAACPAGYGVYDESGTCQFKNEVHGSQASDLQNCTEMERIEMMAPLYQKCMKKTGMLASVGLAQFCLESGYGTTDLARYANNLHGMKTQLSGNTWSGSAWDGKSSYRKQSPEVINGQTIMQWSDFRKYECCEDSIADRAAYFIGAKNGTALRYPGIQTITNYKDQIKAIKNGGYATDPAYVDKLVNIVEKYHLYKYDDVEIEKQQEDILRKDTKWYRIGTGWSNGKCKNQKGAFTSKTNAIKWAKQIAEQEHTEIVVYDPEGQQVFVAAPKEKTVYIIQAGRFQLQKTANRYKDKMTNAGFDVSIHEDEKGLWIQAGVYSNKANAEKMVKKLKAAGFDAFIRE